MKTFYEEFRIYYLPWLVAASAVAIILWQQHTTIELIERINGSYLDRLATVSESLERVNMTLEMEGYMLPPYSSGSRGRRARLPLGGALVEGLREPVQLGGHATWLYDLARIWAVRSGQQVVLVSANDHVHTWNSAHYR